MNTSTLYSPSLELAREIFSLRPLSPWEATSRIFASLERIGFSTPAADEFSPTEFTSVLIRDGSEACMAYFAQTEQKALETAGLAWEAARFVDASATADAASACLASLEQLLGAPFAFLNQCAAWTSEGFPDNACLLLAFWNRDGAAGKAATLGNPAAYQAELKARPDSATLSVTATRNAGVDGAPDTWSLGAFFRC